MNDRFQDLFAVRSAKDRYRHGFGESADEYGEPGELRARHEHHPSDEGGRA